VVAASNLLFPTVISLRYVEQERPRPWGERALFLLAGHLGAISLRCHWNLSSIFLWPWKPLLGVELPLSGHMKRECRSRPRPHEISVGGSPQPPFSSTELAALWPSPVAHHWSCWPGPADQRPPPVHRPSPWVCSGPRWRSRRPCHFTSGPATSTRARRRRWSAFFPVGSKNQQACLAYVAVLFSTALMPSGRAFTVWPSLLA